MTRRYEDALEDYGKSVLSGKRKDSTIYIADPPSRQRVSNAVTVASLNDSVPDAIGNLARQPANDTILNNARRDGIEVAVVCAPNACAFCRTAASRGWSKAENRTIWSQWNGGMHGNCHCAIAPRMGKGGGIDGYSFRELREEYDAADGETSADKIRAMRRSDYEKNGDKIRAQKREAYAKKVHTSGDDKRLRITQIPASTISEKVKSGEYSLKLSQQQYDKHRYGTRDYQRYMEQRERKGYNPQSRLIISKEEAQKIIETQSGTGIIKVRRDGSAMNVEQITCDRIIGEFYYKGKWVKTNKAAIHHGKKGSHLVPIKGNNYD